MDQMKKNVSGWLFLTAFLFSACPVWAQSRDPKVEEMPAIQEIAQFLYANATELSALAHDAQVGDSALTRLQGPLDNMNQRAAGFYDSIAKNARSPWRTVSSYREMVSAFLAARDAFIERPSYRLDPRAFEETAFLMGALLQFYQLPIESITLIAYPRQFYPWIPTYYNFSNCRFANARLYPWSRGVVFRPLVK